MDEQLTPGMVADYLGVASATLRLWANKGLLPYTTTAGGHRRYQREDVVQFARKFGMTRTRGQLNKILIVDDERKLADFLAKKIHDRSPNVEVLAVYSGIQAGLAMAEFAPDLVVLDLMMPGISGIEVAQLIKERRPECVIIGITGFKNTSEEQEFLSAGAETCLYKPIDLDEMFVALGLDDGDASKDGA